MSCRTSVLEFSRPKGTRRHGAKVKTGCRTCKTRHVKCDERKPACARCTNTGRECDGYTQTTPALAATHLSSFLTSLGDNVVYLEFYHYCAMPTLASNFDRDFWSHTVLQMAQTEPSVRHAVIALSYLVKTEPGTLKHARSVSKDGSRKTLLQHYNQAVRSLVERMAQSEHSVEVGLVTCLLFICIEFLRGEYHVAFTHLHNGLKVIAEWHQRPANTFQSSSPLPFSSPTIAKRGVGSKMIATHLVPMFIRAMATGLLYGAPLGPLLWNVCPRPQTLPPKAFNRLRDAQYTLYNLRNATLVWIAAVTRSLHSGTQPTPENHQYHAHLLSCHESWLRAAQDLERGEELSRADYVVISSLKVSYYATYIALAAAFDIYQMSFDAHLDNFQALNHHAKTVLDSMSTTLPTGLAYAPSTTPTRSSLSSSRSSGSETPPSLAPTLRQPAAHFTFEISLIPSLFFSLLRCRCPLTRRRSLSLLSLNPPREALWDAAQHALVARRVIEIEEQALDAQTGWPVRTARLANAIIYPDVDAYGGFRVGFASVGWVLGGRGRASERGVAVREDAEWVEGFVL